MEKKSLIRSKLKMAERERERERDWERDWERERELWEKLLIYIYCLQCLWFFLFIIYLFMYLDLLKDMFVSPTSDSFYFGHKICECFYWSNS